MAPSSDEENKYKNLTLAELQAECNKKELEFNESDNQNDLITLLIEDDNKPPNWGRIYSRVLYHTGMSYEEIARRTIPQIEAILDGADENIPIKTGIPNIFGIPHSATTQNNDGPPKVSQFADIANMFSGI